MKGRRGFNQGKRGIVGTGNDEGILVAMMMENGLGWLSGGSGLRGDAIGCSSWNWYD